MGQACVRTGVRRRLAQPPPSSQPAAVFSARRRLAFRFLDDAVQQMIDHEPDDG